MKIISYKYFSNQSDFEMWQEKEQPEIISISPVVVNMNIKHRFADEDFRKPSTTTVELGSEATYSQAIFVTFYKKVSL